MPVIINKNGIGRQVKNSKCIGYIKAMAVMLLISCSGNPPEPKIVKVDERLFDRQLVTIMKSLELSPSCLDVLQAVNDTNFPPEQQLNEVKIFSRTSGAAIALMISEEYPNWGPRLKRVNKAVLLAADICKQQRNYNYADALADALMFGWLGSVP